MTSDSTSSQAGDDLRAALARYGVSLEDEPIDLLGRYARLLWDWNAKINLTRHTDYDKFVGRDVVDALAVADLIETGERVLDVGTGGGVPGVILAIARPDIRVALCDSIGKKARVVEQIVAELGLDAPVYAARVQDVLAEREFDTLVARAVGPLWKMLSWLGDSWGRFDRLLLIKGPKWGEERNEARHRGLLRELSVRRRAGYHLAGTESEGVILEVRPKADAGDE